MSAHILILGGAKSGKTLLAERTALTLSPNPAYIATAQAHDTEMERRIASHQKLRDGAFTTIEAPLMLGAAIEAAALNHDVILVDCLTLWVSNLMGQRDMDVAVQMQALLATIGLLSEAEVILVSNEVGLGIVPDNAAARAFRDYSGTLHQGLASICGSVAFVVAGLPVMLKGQLPAGV